MPTTIRAASFKNINLRERTELSVDALAGAVQIQVVSTEGYKVGDVIYVGTLSREGCERAAIGSIAGETLLNLASPLVQRHSTFEPVTSVVGDRIRIRRAINVNDKPPLLDAFAVLGHRAIDADQAHSYYTDSTGGAGYWYLTSYWDETSNTETALDPMDALRGDDFGHYVYLEEIRSDAGFDSATNLKDYTIDAHRRAAESEVNAALSNRYTVPFKPVPEIIHTLTLKLASALLRDQARQSSSTRSALADARKMLAQYGSGDVPISDGDGTDLSTSTGVDYDFGDQPRAFTIGQRF
ncbi:DUF1320 domain-containing protein [Cryobacterium sp. TMT1-21]|uniref:phage protein Gp36 family protein n=1 Tax=Cryobacterium sp. TMT1-21 TaxID=1259234 RepID=UPI00106926ED|nr:phage protein Gp36 family protein [Cryobacterium sp. TMT1-21]TFD14184.1 DUF1320 domain-containing protein [Cryobacterium sp. TMT1-21]